MSIRRSAVTTSSKRNTPTAPHIAGLVLAASSMFLAASPAIANSSDPTSDGPTAYNELQETQDSSRESPFIIEVSDPSIDTSSPEVQGQIADLIESAQPELPQASNSGAAITASAVGGQISVVFVDSTPADVQVAVQAAITDWNSVLNIPSNAPIVIDFHWQTLNPGYLGWARPTQFERSGSLPTSDYYPVALANTLLGYDLAPSESEIEIGLASNLYGVSNGWHSGLGSAPAGTRDVYSTMIHEIGHGLGFIGSASQAQGSNPTLDTVPVVYDRLVRYNGSPIVGSGSANIATALRSGNLFISIGGEQLREVYAPSGFLNGSSFSHFDESYQTGQPGSTMTPALGLGQTDRNIDATVLGIMSGIGWPVSVPAIPPTFTSLATQSNQISATWSVDLGQTGLPPVSFSLDARQGTSLAATSNLHWSTGSGVVAGLVSFDEYDLVLTSIPASGEPTSVTKKLAGDPYLVKASGSGLNRTLSWEAPTGPGSNGASYIIRRSKDGGPFQEIGTTSTPSLVDNTLSPGVFQYQVNATSASGTSGSARSLFIGATTTTVRPFALDGQVARLYKAYFDRNPDSTGMAFWLNQRTSGLSLSSMSASFAAGDEFTNTYGSLSNGEFVELVYNEVIGRPSDAIGYQFWLGQLNSGMTRGQMMIGFSEASEFITKTGTTPPQSSLEAAVYRLYVAYFLRAPDSSGYAYWLGQANTGMSLSTISLHFAAGTEFISRYGSLSDDDFITVVYRNVLTREADAGGHTHWLGQLNSGVSRGDVMIGFSNSREFMLATGTLP